MPKDKSKKSDKNTKTLNRVLDDFKQSWDYAQSNYHDTWNDAWKLYNNQRVDEAYEGISQRFVPMVFSTIETILAALAGGKPRFDFQPTKPEQENDTKVLNNLLDYYWDKDRWQATVNKWLRSMLMYGTGVMYVWWDVDHPRLEIVPLRDFIIDPTATSPESARFMGRRYLTTKEQLSSFEYVDPETGETKKLYKNLGKIPKLGGNKGEQMDKDEKDVLFGSTLGDKAKDHQVEIIEHWTRDKVTVVANRGVIIREDENPHLTAAKLRGKTNPTGILPFIVQRNYVDESLVYGKGEIEPIKGLQEALNDLTNQNQDAITYQLSPMWTLDPKYSDWQDQVESLPGAVYPFEAGALIPVPMGNIPADAFNERLNLKNEMRETTAADQVVKGVQSSTANTATEVVAQVNQAAARFDIKIAQIEDEGFYDLAKLVLDLTQLYVTEPMAIRIIGDRKGIDWELFEPEVFIGEYEPNVSLESTVEAKKQDAANTAKELYLAFQQDPGVNQDELRRVTLQKGFDLDPDEVEQLLNVEPVDQQLDGFPVESQGLEVPQEAQGLF